MLKLLRSTPKELARASQPAEELLESPLHPLTFHQIRYIIETQGDRRSLYTQDREVLSNSAVR